MIADRFGGPKGLHLAPFVDAQREPALATKGGWMLGFFNAVLLRPEVILIGDLLVV